MSTPTNRLLVIAAVAAVSGSLFAQPELASTNPEEQLRQQIAELQTEGGSRPAELVNPLRGLAVLYQEAGDHALALAALEEARYVTRIHNGLVSADEALLLRQQIRSEKALGNHQRVWDLEQDMVTIARQHHEDIRMLPIFRELADDRLGVIEQVRAGERPPMIYAGCYNGAATNCFGGTNQSLVLGLQGEILSYYADAIETILRTGDYASEELRQLERAALRVAGRPGRLEFLPTCYGGSLDYFLALEILDSCLAPFVRELPGIAEGHRPLVLANVGNVPGLIRLIQYEIRSAAPAAARANAVAELADWQLLHVPAERRRFDLDGVALALYEGAYRVLEQSGDFQAATQMFAPELPVTLSTYKPNPFASAATEPSRYIDVAFVVTKYGVGERVEILDTSQGATRTEERDLILLIESTSFRPRFVDGKLADSAPVVVRYPLSP